MFRGNHPTRVDEKGRLKLPVDIKREMDEEHGPRFYITSVDGRRAQIYPMKEWEKVEASFELMSPMDPVRRKYQNVTNFFGQMVEMDAQGRLLIPQKLREKAKISGDVEVLGMLRWLEVVNADVFLAEMSSATGEVEMTESELAQFAEKTRVSGK